MPKFTRKNKASRPSPKSAATDDNMSIDDGVSVCSNISDGTSLYDEFEGAANTDPNVDMSSDDLESKLDTSIVDIRNKDLKTRETALRTLQTLFSQKYMYDMILSRKENIIEQLLACLKKGGEVEGRLAPHVISLFMIQLGIQDEDLYQRFHDILLTIVRDNTKPSSIRSSCAHAIGITNYIAGDDILNTYELTKSLENIFSKSYLTEDGTVAPVSNELQQLHTACLSSWGLLLTAMPDGQADDLLKTYLVKIPDLIESNDAELRNVAGETIAVMYEIARDINSVYTEPDDYLLDLLQLKASESAKYKGKKEKRLQRATFREIYNSFEQGTSPQFEVKFGRETLEINTWIKRLHYNTFSRLLGTGMNTHLKENVFIRNVFGMDDPEAEETGSSKGNKFERQLANKAAFKSRTQALKKTRENKQTRTYHVED